MAHAAGDAHEYPIYGAHFRVVFPILDADGDLVPGATGLDSERSTDQGTFADCTNEATEIATSSGMYYLDLTGAEMTGSCISVIVKTTSSGAKTTPITLYPKRAIVLETATAQAGAATTITLAASASANNDYYNGLFILITNDTPAGARYQTRRIIDYVGSTKVATMESAWGTNPASGSTYEILLPETTGVAAWSGVKVFGGVGGGFPSIDVVLWTGGAPSALVSGRVDASVGAMAANVVTAAAIATGAIDADALASDTITAAKIAADAITAAKVADGTIDAATFAAGAINAAAIAAGAIDDDAVAADMDSYTAKVWVIRDGTTADRYGVRWYKNTVPITSGITSPTIRVVKDDDTDLIATVALTEIGTSHRFKRAETTNKIVAGQMYFAVVVATIDGSSRTYEQQIGRDST